MNKERLMKVLLASHVSEKTARLADQSNQIVFKVVRNATKPEIKNAIELLFDVKVKSVSVVNMEGKRKRFGLSHGHRQNWKKAYVTLEPGQDINFLGVE
jgi:large subunit ribosomal protein L23